MMQETNGGQFAEGSGDAAILAGFHEIAEAVVTADVQRSVSRYLRIESEEAQLDELRAVGEFLRGTGGVEPRDEALQTALASLAEETAQLEKTTAASQRSRPDTSDSLHAEQVKRDTARLAQTMVSAWLNVLLRQAEKNGDCALDADLLPLDNHARQIVVERLTTAGQWHRISEQRICQLHVAFVRQLLAQYSQPALEQQGLRLPRDYWYVPSLRGAKAGAGTVVHDLHRIQEASPVRVNQAAYVVADSN